jgi:hypothetical protein
MQLKIHAGDIAGRSRLCAQSPPVIVWRDPLPACAFNGSNCHGRIAASRAFANPPDFCSTSPCARSATKMMSGIHMLATIVGGALAFALLGLPLAIIGLFVQGILAQRSALRAERDESFARTDERARLDRSERTPKATSSRSLKTSTAGRRAAPRVTIKAKPTADEAALASMRRHGGAERPVVTPEPHAIMAAAVGDDRTARACASDRRA